MASSIFAKLSDLIEKHRPELQEEATRDPSCLRKAMRLLEDLAPTAAIRAEELLGEVGDYAAPAAKPFTDTSPISTPRSGAEPSANGDWLRGGPPEEFHEAKQAIGELATRALEKPPGLFSLKARVDPLIRNNFSEDGAPVAHRPDDDASSISTDVPSAALSSRATSDAGDAAPPGLADLAEEQHPPGGGDPHVVVERTPYSNVWRQEDVYQVRVDVERRKRRNELPESTRVRLAVRPIFQEYTYAHHERKRLHDFVRDMKPESMDARFFYGNARCTDCDGNEFDPDVFTELRETHFPVKVRCLQKVLVFEYSQLATPIEKVLEIWCDDQMTRCLHTFFKGCQRRSSCHFSHMGARPHAIRDPKV